MSPLRRTMLLGALAGMTAPARGDDAVRRGRALSFPRDHGAHPASHIEWWYATGWLGDFESPSAGFQLTFFRNRVERAAQVSGRLAPRQLLFAHAAITDVKRGRHSHAERIARWSGEGTSGPAWARSDDGEVRIGPWQLRRSGAAWQVDIRGDVALEGELQRTQPLLLQGDQGFSRKGPEEANASHYYSEVQLLARLKRTGSEAIETGRAWLDHEWSDALMHRDAVGWDWIGINLEAGAALTAFRLRRADGSALWAGGSHRAGDGTTTIFAPGDVRFEPGRRWTSAATAARYPVTWQVHTPAGRFAIEALLDAQEVDARRSTGTLYWEGLAQARDAQGRRVGLGYLEMTGYGGRIRLG